MVAGYTEHGRGNIKLENHPIGNAVTFFRIASVSFILVMMNVFSVCDNVSFRKIGMASTYTSQTIPLSLCYMLDASTLQRYVSITESISGGWNSRMTHKIIWLVMFHDIHITGLEHASDIIDNLNLILNQHCYSNTKLMLREPYIYKSAFEQF